MSFETNIIMTLCEMRRKYSIQRACIPLRCFCCCSILTRAPAKCHNKSNRNNQTFKIQMVCHLMSFLSFLFNSFPIKLYRQKSTNAKSMAVLALTQVTNKRKYLDNQIKLMSTESIHINNIVCRVLCSTYTEYKVYMNTLVYFTGIQMKTIHAHTHTQ